MGRTGGSHRLRAQATGSLGDITYSDRIKVFELIRAFGMPTLNYSQHVIQLCPLRSSIGSCISRRALRTEIGARPGSTV
jgi:hypothetical protein